MLDELRADLAAAQSRLAVVCFLPPCPELLSEFETAARRVRAGARIYIDGTTSTSLRRFDAEWMRRVVLRAGGNIHAKVIIADRALWLGSWNMAARSALSQYDVQHRTTCPVLRRRAWRWLDDLDARVDTVQCGSVPRGNSPRGGDKRSRALRADSNYDPDLGF